jgi:hypothetical protein
MTGLTKIRQVRESQESKERNLAELHGEAGAAAKCDLWKQRVRRDGAEWQTVGIFFLSVPVPEAQRMDADASDIVATVNEVSTNNVALIHQHLGAEVAD